MTRRHLPTLESARVIDCRRHFNNADRWEDENSNVRRPLDGVDVVRCRGESNVGGICDKNDCVVDVSAVERLICERNLALQDEKCEN